MIKNEEVHKAQEIFIMFFPKCTDLSKKLQNKFMLNTKGEEFQQTSTKQMLALHFLVSCLNQRQPAPLLGQTQN